MDEQARTRLSKFLSLALRHRPEMIDIQLDRQGWTDIETLLAQCHSHGKSISRSMLNEVVEKNSKQRFAISEDGLRIRVNQGHSVDVELGYEAASPPEVLFHGTVVDRVKSIHSRGLLRMKRHHVHLSSDRATAMKVGERRGQPVILQIQAGKMHQDGYVFFLSANGVWLTETVPPEYLEFNLIDWQPLAGDAR